MKKRKAKRGKTKDKQERQQEIAEERKEQRQLEKLLPTGLLVSYHLEGWRFGYIDSVNAKTRVVKIKPIPPYRGEAVRCISIPLKDVKKIEEGDS